MTASDEALAARAVAAAKWRFLSLLTRFSLQFVVTLVIARLVGPKGFGPVAVALVFVGLSDAVADGGMGHALIQRPTLSEHHLRVALTLSAASGALLSLVVFGLASPLATLFDDKQAESVLRAVAAVFLLTSLGAVPTALMQRNLDVRRMFFVDLVSYVVGYALVGTILAVAGAGAWALVAAVLMRSGLNMVAVHLACPCPLRPSVRHQERRELLGYGVGTLLARIMNYAAGNGDYVVVGHSLGAASLSLYNRAYQLMSLPIVTIGSVITYVMFPAFSEIQADPERLRAAFLRTVRFTSVVVFPTLSVMMVAGPHLVATLYGPRWDEAITPFQILCLGGFFRTFNTMADSVIRALGAVYRQSLRHLFYAVGVVVGATIGSRWGTDGVAVGVVVALLFMYGLLGSLSLRLLELPWRLLLRAHGPGITLAGTVAVPALVVREFVDRITDLDAVVVIAVGASAFTLYAALLAWFPAQSLQDTRRVVHTELRRLRRSR